MNLDQYKIENSRTIQSILDKQEAPRIIECKKTFWDAEVCVDCRLISEESGRVVLFHELEKQWNIEGLIIEPPMFTIAFYWADRPYNLYCWFHADGSYIAAYFNIVALPGYEFRNGMLIYHDLVLDVLVPPQRKPVILDMKELSDMDPDTSKEVKDISESILRSAERIVGESMHTLPDWLQSKDS